MDEFLDVLLEGPYNRNHWRSPQKNSWRNLIGTPTWILEKPLEELLEQTLEEYKRNSWRNLIGVPGGIPDGAPGGITGTILGGTDGGIP